MQESLSKVQQQLRLIAAMDERYTASAVDGVYGEKTAEALRRFQEIGGLPVTGEADEITIEAIRKVYEELSQLVADPEPIFPFPSPYFVIKDNESGTLIHILQAMLREISSDFDMEPPPMTGHYDKETKAHVIRWQQVLGLPATGHIDRAAWDQLAGLYNMRLL